VPRDASGRPKKEDARLAMDPADIAWFYEARIVDNKRCDNQRGQQLMMFCNLSTRF
jgi:hypothetical protein